MTTKFKPGDAVYVVAREHIRVAFVERIDIRQPGDIYYFLKFADQPHPPIIEARLGTTPDEACALFQELEHANIERIAKNAKDIYKRAKR